MHLVAPFEDWTIRGRWWPTMRRRKQAIAVVFHHAVTDITGRTDLQQVQDVEEVIYRRRFRSRFTMFAYCFALSHGARLYEGRGTKYRNGANNDTKGTGYNNSNTISVVLCGNYEHGVPGIPTLTPTEAQAKMAAALVRDLVRAGVVVDWPEVVLLPHNHVHSTACPGDNVEGAWLNRVRDLVAMPAPQPPDEHEGLPAMYDVQRDSEVGTTWATWTVNGTTHVRWFGTDRPDATDKPGGAWVIDEQPSIVKTNPSASPYA
jgi:hypothetical protein